MSREQYRARSKKVQKLGRDGLVEQDKATGREERISQRESDVSFGPNRTQEHGLRRRVPEKGENRRQRPRSSPHQESAQPADVDTPEVPGAIPAMRQADDASVMAALPASVSRAADTPCHLSQPSPHPESAQSAAGDTPDVPETTPAMRQTDDVPTSAPPLISNGRTAKKRHQQKRASRLNPDTPSHFNAKDDGDGGRLQFEPEQAHPADTASQGDTEPDAQRSADNAPMRERPPGRSVPPPIQRRTKGGGRLQFEPGRDPTTDTASLGDTEPSAPHGADVPVREWPPGRTAPPPIHRRAKGGGRLRFEAERTPPPGDSDTRSRRVEGADASAPVEPRPHGDTPTPQPASDPAAGLTHRQRKQYEKAERRVERSGRRLEKAQARLPTRRRARLKQEYDIKSGKVRRRLRFETEVKPEAVSPSLPAQAGRTLKTAAVMKLHGKLRETEQDNTAVEAAHKGEFAAERGAGRFLRWNKQRLRSKPYRTVRRAEHRLRTDQARLAWQTALRDDPNLRHKNSLTKWVQKQKIKRKYAQAAREAQKTAQHTQEAVTVTGKIVRAVQRYAAAHKGALLIAAMLALVIVLFSAGLTSCVAILSGGQSAYLSATWLSDEQDICDAELYFTGLETDLQLDISNTEANYSGYDEYRYSIGDIGHDPYELMSYLSAAYGVFTFDRVRPELDRLFGEMYQLTRTPVTETRYDDEGNPYEWRVLQITLTVGRLGDIISASLVPGEQTDLYAVYMQSHGNRQTFSNPFDFPWLGYVSSGYGWRVHPISGEKNLHRGVDIAAAEGTAIQAVHDGRVVSAGDAGSYGLCVVIEDGNGYQSRYAHCSSLNVSVGQLVRRGDVISAVGSTGDSTGPHLHLEVMLNGEYLNPYYFVDTVG